MKYHNSINITENLFCYIWQGMGNNCNTCVLASVLKGNKHVIIDTGHIINEMQEDCFRSLEETMKADNLRVEDIGLIINTHTHPDHCEANAPIINKSGAEVTISKEEDDYRLTIGKSIYSMFGMTLPDFTPAFYLKEGALNLGKDGFQARVILTPGHSPGSICLYLPDTKILITGDVIFFMSVGRTDFPGGNTMLLKQSIERLAKLDTEYLVPGHNTEPGGIIRGKEKIKRNFIAVQEYF